MFVPRSTFSASGLLLPVISALLRQSVRPPRVRADIRFNASETRAWER
jgi:hypothetical protein